VTSGPGYSLMMEQVGYAAMTETPCVFVNVQRGGPSTGLPTLPAQADMMQARWGSHGDYGIIALCPNSPQECFDLTITAFNLSEEFRVPVMLMLDECVGHMTEKVIIPKAEEIEITPRRFTAREPREFRVFEPREDGVPDMVKAGDGYRFHVTGLTHDDRGYPSMNVETQDRMIRRLQKKLEPLAGPRALAETADLEDAEVVVVSYGITSRVAQRAIGLARQRGIRAGKFRIISAWPFPLQRIRDIASRVKALVVPELNLGQMVLEVERAAAGQAKVIPVTHAGGTVHDPDVILNAIVEAVR
jgi:2-oxoglutarate ferredoxin oxidoreductase subunit alpha